MDLGLIGELTARWLAGDGWSPWNGGSPPDAETSELVPYLAAMAQSGFVTTFSQPGLADPSWLQRAVVDGLCDEDVADRLAGVSQETDLVVITHYPGVATPYEIPISVDEGRTNTSRLVRRPRTRSGPTCIPRPSRSSAPPGR